MKRAIDKPKKHKGSRAFYKYVMNFAPANSRELVVNVQNTVTVIASVLTRSPNANQPKFDQLYSSGLEVSNLKVKNFGVFVTLRWGPAQKLLNFV